MHTKDKCEYIQIVPASIHDSIQRVQLPSLIRRLLKLLLVAYGSLFIWISVLAPAAKSQTILERATRHQQ